MKKRTLLSIFIITVLFSGCDSASDAAADIKDKLIEAYWGDVDGLVMEVKEEDASVVDFGESGLGSNHSIFDGTTQPILRNIERTGPNTWDAEVVKGTYDDDGVLTAIDYEPTTITSTTNSEGKETLTLSNVSDPALQNWVQKDSDYTPPIPEEPEEPEVPEVPVEIVCDYTHTQTEQGNTIQFTNYWRGDMDFQDVPTESFYYKPLNHYPTTTPCHYKIEGTAHKVYYVGNEFDFRVIILLPEKPTESRTYDIDNSPYASIFPLGEGKASVSMDAQYYPKNTTDKLNITVSGGKITATVTALELTSDSYGDCTVTCTLTGN